MTYQPDPTVREPLAARAGGPPVTPLGIRAEEIALHWQCSTYTFHRRRKAGEFSPEPINPGHGNALVWNRAEVMAFFAGLGLTKEVV